MSGSAVIVLSPADNVTVSRRHIAAGEPLVIDGETLVALCDVASAVAEPVLGPTKPDPGAPSARE